MHSVKAGLCLLFPHCSPRGREWIQCLADDKGERKGTRKRGRLGEGDKRRGYPRR